MTCPAKHDLTSLRLLGTVGEPINPEAWMWYQEKIGGGRCPIVDTWWQTETGAIMISGLPGVSTMKPGFAGKPLPGYLCHHPGRVGQGGQEGSGLLAITHPWPSMLPTVWGDDERYVQTYFSKWDNKTYFPGDGAKRDKSGNFMILGRVDDVLNVSAHRIGTMEIESALVDHPAVAEAAVVGRAHELKGQAIVAFVSLKNGLATTQRAGGGAEAARGEEDRRARAARGDSLHPRPAQDALGQDHAPPAPRHCRGADAGRRHDAGGSRGCGRAPRPVRGNLRGVSRPGSAGSFPSRKDDHMAKIVCVLYEDPVTGYPKSYPRDDIPSFDTYPNGQTVPSPKAIDFKPGSCWAAYPGSWG